MRQRRGGGNWRGQGGGRDSYSSGGNWGAGPYDPYPKNDPPAADIYGYRTDRRDVPPRDGPRSGYGGMGGVQQKQQSRSYQAGYRGPAPPRNTGYGGASRNDYGRPPPQRHPGSGPRQDRPRKRPFVNNSSYRPSSKRPRLGNKSSSQPASGGKSRRASRPSRRQELRPATFTLGSGVPGESEEHKFLAVKFQTHPYVRPSASINNETGTITFEIHEVNKYGRKKNNNASRVEFQVLERDISTILAFEGDKIPEDIALKVAEEVVDLTQEDENADKGATEEAEKEGMDEDEKPAEGDAEGAEGDAAGEEKADEAEPEVKINPDTMNCAQLRKELQKRGLGSRGLKAELIRRLKESIEEEENPSQQQPEEEAEVEAEEEEADAAQEGEENAEEAATDGKEKAATDGKEKEDPAVIEKDEPTAKTAEEESSDDEPIIKKTTAGAKADEEEEDAEGGRGDEADPVVQPEIELSDVEGARGDEPEPEAAEPEAEAEAEAEEAEEAPEAEDKETAGATETPAEEEVGDEEAAEGDEEAKPVEGDDQPQDETMEEKPEDDGEGKQEEDAKKEPAKVQSTSFRVVIGLKRAPRVSRRGDHLLPRDDITQARVIILEFALLSGQPAKDDPKKAFMDAMAGPFKKVANGNPWPGEGPNSFRHTLSTLLTQMQEARVEEKRLAGAAAMFQENQDLKKEKKQLEDKLKKLQGQLDDGKKRIKRAKEALNA